MSATTIVEDLDRARRKAMLNADVATLDGLFADDLVWIHGSGRVDDKATLLSAIGSHTVRYTAMEVLDETVRDLGGTVLLGGVVAMTVVLNGQTRDLKNRFTIVWAHRDERWLVVNWQSTAAAH